MIWGALLLLSAVLLSVSLVSRTSRWIGAVVGGIGFGLLVDEVGKFLTSDNNYFFRPAPALIYAVIISVFLASRFVVRSRPLSQREYLASAFDLAKKIAARDFDERDRRRALAYLDASREADTTRRLRALIETAPASATESPLDRLQDAVTQRIEGWRQRAWFYRFLALAVLAGALITAIEIIVILMLRHRGWEDGLPAMASAAVHAQAGLSVVSLLELSVALLSIAFAALGVATTTDDPRGLRFSELSLFLGVAFLQPFAFYEAQFFAFAGMVLGILTIIVIQYASERAQPPGRLASPAVEGERPGKRSRTARARHRRTAVAPDPSARR
jgi:hypothetical protein